MNKEMGSINKALSANTMDNNINCSILLFCHSETLIAQVKHILVDCEVTVRQNTCEIKTQVETLAPKLVLIDVEKRGDEFYSCLHTIKNDAALNYIPVILLTCDDSEEKRVKGLEAGADDFIPKPVNENVLRLRVKNILKLYHQEIVLKELNEQLKHKLAEKKEIIAKNERLTKFFPSRLLNWILSADHDMGLSSEKKKLTIFFSDLVGFTEFAERNPPIQVRNMLNDYFTEMVTLVDRYGGTFDKFIGDGLMAFFGAPEHMDQQGQALRAVSMAVAMHYKMKDLTEKWRRQGIVKPIRIRMGIHQDNVMVGNLGSRQVMEYTVFGSGVNLASRLESYCEPDKILVSLPVYSYTRNHFPYGEVKEQIFRGFERLVPVSVLDPESVPHPAGGFCEIVTGDF